MRTYKKIKCELCGFEISIQQMNRHKAYCNGLGPKEQRKNKNSGLNWSKGKTFKEIYGEERAKEIGNKISKKLVGNSTGKCSTPEKEEERKRKIALSMKGNKNGSTSFRRRNIIYKDIHFKSSWEINVAKYFDENNIIWEYENINYSLSDTRSYTPDFSIYENDHFIKHVEVKGYFRKENKEKFEEFQRLYPDVIVEIWNKKVLLNKKIQT